ncbi:beta-ketoacyl-ACP synthase III [Halalkalibacter krulwichiae]|uniref:Beta-ketoacyl-[acyl-carrier-protein] synthase III n=1 Tax=Halalkalibacter krulwichiae TaxID=199441 RepID=A0A1X9M8B6_9BACI|nr:beta-ketoacyl-ACP synthase III [Halalkalibacter krulwichiae]ARK28914.1 3-oxoacyl-[acyl-carrier-protein] synthase 3 [Halalkalibacter krulwichiae]
MKKAIISGAGSYVPSTIMTNQDLEQLMDTSHEWIATRTGIHERRVIDSTENTSDLALKASLAALEDAGLQPMDIDLIIVATETPDHMFPPVATKLQSLLGCRTVGAFDVHSTCVGFISALQIAEQYIKIGKANHILVVGADALSKIVDYTDRSTAILFADGAGAFVVSGADQAESEGIIDSTIHSDGQFYEDLYVEGGSSRERDNSDYTIPKIKMNGNKIFKLAVNAMSNNVKELLVRNDVQYEEIDWLIPHQANQRIIDAVARNVEFPQQKVISNIKYFGNNSAATIPLAFTMARKEGKVKKGDRIVLTAFGGGLIWGSLLFQY